MKNIWQLVALIPEFRTRIFAAILLNALLGLTTVASPYLIKIVVDEASLVAHSSHPLNLMRSGLIIVGLLLGVRIVTAITDMYEDRLNSRLFFSINVALRERVVSHLIGLSIDYYERIRVGEVIDHALTGVGSFANWLNSLLQNVLSLIFGLAFSLVIIFHTSLLAGAVLLIAIVINYLLARRAFQQTKPNLKQAQKIMSEASGYLSESLSQVSSVRIFGTETLVTNRYTERLQRWKDLSYSRVNFRSRTYAIREGIMAIGAVGAIAIVFAAVARHAASPGDIILVLLLSNQMTGQIRQIALLSQNTSETDVSVERTLEVLAEQPSLHDRPDAIELPILESIEFIGVVFRYPGKKRRILDGVSFRMQAGETLALVGPSGVGKTTITKLLLRFYAPSSGQILINGQPIETFTQVSIRRHIGMVMQDVALLNDAIEENLRFAKADASQAEIRDAATGAHANVFIDKLPEKYQTLVGERGIKLSGGEKQRIAVARAILRQPQLIILDEATSALDSESEHFVQDGLAKLMAGRTAIVIAHRLSTIMKADKILVLQDGRIIEQGTHAQLTSKKTGLYARLFKLQTEGTIS